MTEKLEKLFSSLNYIMFVTDNIKYTLNKLIFYALSAPTLSISLLRVR